MDRSIKTRRVIKDIKTASRRTGAASAKEAAIRTREAARGAAPAPEPSGESGSEPDDAASTAKGADLAQGALRAFRAHARNAQAKRQPDKGGQSASPPAQAPGKRPGAKGRDMAKHAPRADGKAAKAPGKPPSHAPASRPAKVEPIGGARPAPRASQPNPLKARVRRSGFSRQASPAAPKTAKRASDGLKSFARMAAASARSLSTAMAALGATAVSAVVVVLLAALVATSPFGIFFTGGDMGDGNPSLREVVSQLNKEHSERIEQIKAENPHDETALTGAKTAWKETLAVYAVKTTTDEDNPLDVVTLDAERQRIVRDVFWEMNRIESRVETREVVEIALEEDGEGNSVEVEKTSTRRTLYIELSHSTAEEAATAYGFDADQTDMLRQLLEEKNDLLWQSVLFGIGSEGGDIVEIAASQIGNVGGQPYWSWYGFPSRVEWCACFVSWCADQCGYIEEGRVPKFAYCPTGVQWFKDAGRWQDRGYTPQPGDIVFFDWGGDGVSDHVGIVESCDGTTVFTIEGNSGDACQRNSYEISSSSVLGYGKVAP